MGRRARPVAAGLTYHLTARGVERRPIFRDDHDRRVLEGLLASVVDDHEWDVLTACFMPNHLHLVVHTPSPDLSLGMRELLGPYARRFNDRHTRVGPLFAGRYHAQVVWRERHLVELFRYVALNPVRAGLAAGPAAYGWSTHRALAGLQPAPRWLARERALATFGGDPGRYRAFVSDGDPKGTLLGRLLREDGLDDLQAALDAGFSQRDIAVELGVTQSMLARRLRQGR